MTHPSAPGESYEPEHIDKRLAFEREIGDLLRITSALMEDSIIPKQETRSATELPFGRFNEDQLAVSVTRLNGMPYSATLTFNPNEADTSARPFTFTCELPAKTWEDLSRKRRSSHEGIVKHLDANWPSLQLDNTLPRDALSHREVSLDDIVGIVDEGILAQHTESVCTERVYETSRVGVARFSGGSSNLLETNCRFVTADYPGNPKYISVQFRQPHQLPGDIIRYTVYTVSTHGVSDEHPNIRAHYENASGKRLSGEPPIDAEALRDALSKYIGDMIDSQTQYTAFPNITPEDFQESNER